MNKSFLSGRAYSPQSIAPSFWWLTQYPAPLSKHPFISSALQPTPPKITPESLSSPASPSSLLGAPDITIFFLTSLAPPVHSPMTFYPSPPASLPLSFDPPEIMLSFNDTLAGASALTLDLISVAEQRPWQMPALRAQCACACIPQSCYTRPKREWTAIDFNWSQMAPNTYHLPGSLALLALNG